MAMARLCFKCRRVATSKRLASLDGLLGMLVANTP
jgi:hypothetical protein